MSIFGHVSPQFQGYAPFSIELGSNGDITHDQPSGLATLNRHIIQNPDIMKVFQEASPEFIKETILPVLKDACNSAQSCVQIWCNTFLRINESLTPHFRRWVLSVLYLYTNHRSEMFYISCQLHTLIYFFGAVIILFFKQVHTQQCLRENTVLCIETSIQNLILITYIILLLMLFHVHTRF